jgi:hypothetical protein
MLCCLNVLWNYLWSVHPTVAASLIALVGIAGSLWINRIEQRRDQFLRLRRDVYLSAAEAFAAAAQFAGNLHDAGVQVRDGRALLRDLSGAIAKIHLIGGKDVIATVMALNTKFVDHYRQQMLKKTRADTIENTVNRNIGTIRAIVIRLSQNLQAQPSENDRVNQLIRENQHLERKLYEVRLEMIDSTLTFQEEVAASSGHAALALKRELGIKVDEPWYLEMLQLSERLSVQKHRAYIEESKEQQKPRGG